MGNLCSSTAFRRKHGVTGEPRHSLPESCLPRWPCPRRFAQSEGLLAENDAESYFGYENLVWLLESTIVSFVI